MCTSRSISVNFDQSCWTNIPVDSLYLTWQKEATLSSACQFNENGQATGSCGVVGFNTGNENHAVFRFYVVQKLPDTVVTTMSPVELVCKFESPTSSANLTVSDTTDSPVIQIVSAQDVIKDYDIQLVTKTQSTPVYTGDIITVDMTYTPISSATAFRFSSCEASIGPVTIPLLENGCPNAWSMRNIGLVQYSKLHEISFIAFSLEGFSNLSVSCSVIMVNALDPDLLSYQNSCTSTTSRSSQVLNETLKRTFTIQSNLDIRKTYAQSSEKKIFTIMSTMLIFVVLTL
ncbi:unnamed protein product [Oikopleura dioica]|uniref:ZP domain-containing protein n=1 Tax=Oikopleura dioica TaxID=34765 RepID=E4YSD3_OIKDI|nr:unnamed protein product [Oikopleura dioica]